MRTPDVVTHPEATRHVPPPAVGERVGHDEGVRSAKTKSAWAQGGYPAMDETPRSGCEHPIIVPHGDSPTCVLASWAKMPVEAAGHAGPRGPSGSITTLREDDPFHDRQVISLGGTRHLDSAEAG